MIHALVLGWILAVIPPTPTSYVTDNAQTLSASTQAKLETELHDFDRKTGDQVLVWIGQSTNGESLENFTVDAAQKWGAGRKGKDNGAILFLFMRDHKVRIEVGYGLESVLTDAQSARIISTSVMPRMRAGDTDGAVTGAVDQMLSVIDPTFASTSSAPQSASSDDTMAAIVMVLIFVVVVGGLIFAGVLTLVRKGKRHGDWLDGFMFVNPPGSGGRGGFFGGGGGFSGGGGGFSGGGGGFGGGGASGGW